MPSSLFTKLTSVAIAYQAIAYLFICTLFGLEVLALRMPAWAQSIENPSVDIHTALTHTARDNADADARAVYSFSLGQGTLTDELLPLTARKLDVSAEPVGLDQVSDAFNDQMVIKRQEVAAEGLQLDSLPIIGELLDESGNLDVGIDLPVDMSISNVMGETGLIISTDFTVN